MKLTHQKKLIEKLKKENLKLRNQLADKNLELIEAYKKISDLPTESSGITSIFSFKKILHALGWAIVIAFIISFFMATFFFLNSNK